MSEKIPTWLPELEKWEKAKYDGIKGSPPEWVPQPYKNKFLSARNTLFRMTMEKNGEYHELKSRLDKLVTEKYYRIVQALMKEENVNVYDESLFILADLYKISLLDPEEGLKKLAGEDAALGVHRRGQLREFAKTNAEERHNDRAKEWKRWQKEAGRLIEINPRLAGKNKKSDLARKVKENLSLLDTVQTIRKRL